MPNEKQLNYKYEGKIPKKGGQLESDGKRVRVIAEMLNPTEPEWELITGAAATIVIQP